ncbi:polysaccharide deacetylase family protein [Microbispora sp. RL4-1S]|uniref:Polysaccharide deacetylase family protein n=1 Tax=Microbispora oryzae TaxID=2806554 RepID=A0A941AK39_9ACTN|nr:polysaccharide deacetylase family protein [Microbispora oryzae]MBP2704803.1 polysaccharide deacetylase family protein [Microbispora oryzae]
MPFRTLIPLTLACALAAAAAVPAQADSAQAASARREPFCATHKCIALTFDDGPADYTETLLKTLATYHAKATFFVIGNRVEKHPKLTAMIAKAGHEVGNHTWDHKYLTDLTYEQINKEIGDAQRIITKATGKAPVLFRAPGGLRNGGVEEITAKFGLIQIPGTVATKDYIKDYRDVGVLTSRALDVAGEGEVVLMHETVKQTVQSLPAVLKKLTAEDYHFVTVSTLLEGQELIPGQVYPEQSSVVAG